MTKIKRNYSKRRLENLVNRNQRYHNNNVRTPESIPSNPSTRTGYKMEENIRNLVTNPPQNKSRTFLPDEEPSLVESIKNTCQLTSLNLPYNTQTDNNPINVDIIRLK